jgi:oligoendopeptidase F
VHGDVVEALLGACRKNVGVFQDFFRLKAKFLGMKRMRRVHLYAPLSTKDRKYRFGDAVTTVLNAFDSFDPKFSDLARRVFKERHVDSEIRKGKESGAFCMSVIPKITPYVMLNFAGGMRDLYAIAHESGHAVHDQLAAGHSYLTFQPPLVLAETASVFGEMVLFDRFMSEETEGDVRRGVLIEKLSEMYGTICRQSFFVLFEKEAHDAIADGATTDKLCSIYLSNLKEQFGEAVSVPGEFKWEWTYVPHFYHTPFYCYAYAFGNLLTLSLYDMYRREGRGFIASYYRILSYGGSASPVDILSEAGVDIASSQFWESGFNVLRGMVRQLRET